MDRLSQFVGMISQSFAATNGQAVAVLLTVGAFAVTGLILYGRTRGREFLMAGLSAAVFLVPMIRIH